LLLYQTEVADVPINESVVHQSGYRAARDLVKNNLAYREAIPCLGKQNSLKSGTLGNLRNIQTPRAIIRYC
jgi:hypothetical protein